MNCISKKELVKSAARVLDLLEEFALTTEPLGVSEVARRIGIPKSSAQGLLTTLSIRGYLDKAGTGYVLPAGLRGTAWVGGRLAKLTRAAQPVMRRVADATGESAFLGVLTPERMIRYVIKEVSANEVRYDAPLAHLRPAHCTSIGLVILAFLPQAEGDALLRQLPLPKVTPFTVTDRRALKKLLTQAQARGYAEVRNAHVDGASGVSAPVFGPDGKVMAGLNLGAPSSRYTKVRAQMIREVVKAANELSRQFALGPTSRASTV